MSHMDKTAVCALIEDGIPGAEVHVYSPRHHDDEDHLGAVVIAPTFEGESLVTRHQQVHDALGGHLTRDIHAIELRTYTPQEFADADRSWMPADEQP